MSKQTDAPQAGEPGPVEEEPDAPPTVDTAATPANDAAASVDAGSAGADVSAASPSAPAAAPRVAPAKLLGARRAKVEAALGRLRPGSEGWMLGGDLEVRLSEGRCVGLRGHVPEDMDCNNAALWLGYGPDAYPLRRAESCEWPGLSLKHRLAPGVAGRYVPATRVFELWRLE